MTESKSVEIHEFSTGIRYQGSANNWVSLGFTGQYMNVTIKKIPYAVERSIANKEFAVAEGASSKKPAVIGRVVLGGNEEPDWSVVAIVTRGRDEHGRTASFYRYFLCEGRDSLPHILAWIEDYRQRNGQMPVFNPFEVKVVGQSNSSRVPCLEFDLTREMQFKLENETAPLIIQPGQQPHALTPIPPHQASRTKDYHLRGKGEEKTSVILPGKISNNVYYKSTEKAKTNCQSFNDEALEQPEEQQYTPEHINKLATEKVKTNGQSVAWAFNVEALEQLKGFQVIQAASATAYSLLQKAKINTPEFPATVVDEQAIKSALKGLMNSSIAKPEYVEAIANSLGDNQIPESYWREIFDSQGANNALRQGIYSPQMVRLLMLRTIVIPETLPDYLVWLEKGNKQNNIYKVAAEFESQISQAFSNKSETKESLQNKISEGFQFLLPSLLEKKVSAEAVYRLLTLSNGIWRKYPHQFLEYIECDLKIVKSFFLKYKIIPKNSDLKLKYDFWQKTSELLNNNKQQHDLQEFKKFADIFDEFGKPEVSAFFYYVFYKEVPKKIFHKLPNHHNKYKLDIYGIKVAMKLSLFEKIGFAVINKLTMNERLPIEVILILLSLILLSFAVGLIFRGLSSSSRETISATTPTSSLSPARPSPTTTASQLPKVNSSEEAHNNSVKTSKAIKEMEKELNLIFKTIKKEINHLFANKKPDDEKRDIQENKTPVKDK